MARRQDGVDTVELNEITNVKGDPDLTYGSLGGTNAVVPFNQGIQFLAAGARAKAESDQYKYNQFQENLKNFYAKFDDIKVEGLMESDYPIINQEYADLAKEIANNYDIIRQPTKDPEKFAMIKEKEAQFRGRISRSKQDLAYRTAHQTFINSNPEFNTDTNKARIQDFNTKTIGVRQLYNLDTPFTYDVKSRAEIANAIAEEKTKAEATNNRFITQEDRIRYKEAEYDKAWAATALNTDKTGRPIRDAASEQYAKLYGADVVKNNFDQIDLEVGRSLRKQDAVSTTMRPDAYGLQDDQQAFEAGQQAKRLASAERIADDKTLKGFGRLYAETWTNAYTTGAVDQNLAQITWGDNTEITVTDKTGGGYDATGNIVPTKETQVKVPKITAKSGGLDANGNLIIERYDNETKAPLPALIVPKEEGRQAFYKIAGSQNARGVAAESEKYLRDNNRGRNVELQPLQKHFKLTNTDQKVKIIKGL